MKVSQSNLLHARLLLNGEITLSLKIDEDSCENENNQSVLELAQVTCVCVLARIIYRIYLRSVNSENCSFYPSVHN